MIFRQDTPQGRLPGRGAWRVRSALLVSAAMALGAPAKLVHGQRLDRFDAGITFQTIDHFAAHDSWTGQAYGAWEPARRELIADALFDRDNGIGLSGWYFHLAAGVDASIASKNYPWQLRTQESFLVGPGVYDWNRNAATRTLLADALARGIERTMMVVYSPPVGMTVNGKPYPSASGNNLAAGSEQQFAGYIADVLEHFKHHPDPAQRVEFDYVSPVNEPEYDWSGGSQEGNGRLSAATIRGRYILPLATELRARGLATGIRGPESAKLQSLSGGENYLRNLAGNTTVNGLLGNVLSYHSYFSDNDANMLPRRQEAAAAAAAYPGLDLWQTEYCILFDDASAGLSGAGNDTSMTTALAVARTMHFDLTVANAAAWSYWLAATPWEHNYKDGLIYFDNARQTFQVAKVGWAMAHYSRFIRPGAERIAFAGANDDIAGLLASGWKHEETGDLTLVYTNQLGTSQTVLPLVTGVDSLKSDYFTPYRTTDASIDNLRQLPSFLAGQSATLPARSLTTFVGGTFAEDNTGKYIPAIVGERDYTLGGGMLTVLDGGGTYSGRFAGPGGFIKQGGKTLTLTGRSQHTGGTTVAAGSLVIAAADGVESAVGTGRLLIEAGASVSTGPNAFGWNPSTPLVINGGLLHQQIAESRLAAVTLTGGTLSGSPATSFSLRGPITVRAASEPALLTVPAVSIDAILRLDVEDGPAAVDLQIHSAIGGAFGFVKAGTGLLELLGAGTFGGDTVVTGGTLRVGHPRGLGESRLFINAGSRVELTGGTALEVQQLGMSGGGLDLGGGRLTITEGGSEAAIRSLILAGRGGNGQDDEGILSSVAKASPARLSIGYRSDGSGGITVALAGVGDATLDGEVDLFDLVAMASAGRYQTGLAANWNQGDADYSGRFDVFDLLAIASSGNYATGPITATAVPEPSTAWWAVAWAGGLGLLARSAGPRPVRLHALNAPASPPVRIGFREIMTMSRGAGLRIT